MIELPISGPEGIRRQVTQFEADGQFSTASASQWTTPRIEDLHLTSNRNLGKAEFTEYKGTRADLIREIHAAELDGDELGYLLEKVAELKGLK